MFVLFSSVIQLLYSLDSFHEHISGTQLEGGGRGGGLPCPFLKIKEKCPDFGKKCPNWVKFMSSVG